MTAHYEIDESGNVKGATISYMPPLHLMVDPEEMRKGFERMKAQMAKLKSQELPPWASR